MFWIAYYANLWVYPVFEVMGWTQRIIFLVTCWMLMFACYFVGELLTSVLWREYYLLTKREPPVLLWLFLSFLAGAVV